MSETTSQSNAPVDSALLEKMGITVPYDAVRFYTEKNIIVFTVEQFDERGCSIIAREELYGYELSDEQIKALQEANCYHETPCELT